MRILLSLNEARAILSSWLMLSGVPFHKTQRLSLSDEQQRRFDQIKDELLSKRNSLYQQHGIEIQHRGSDWEIEVDLSSSDLQMCAAALRNCLEECAGSAVTMDLHLSCRSESELNQVVQRLQFLANNP